MWLLDLHAALNDMAVFLPSSALPYAAAKVKSQLALEFFF